MGMVAIRACTVYHSIGSWTWGGFQYQAIVTLNPGGGLHWWNGVTRSSLFPLKQTASCGRGRETEGETCTLPPRAGTAAV